MLKKNLTFLLFLFSTFCFGQNDSLLLSRTSAFTDSIDFIQIRTDTLFGSKQIISLIVLQKKNFNRFHPELAYSRSELKTTSFFGITKNALVAINGSFFDRDNGGSVTYVENHDNVISRTRPSNRKWAKPDSLINGAIVFRNDTVEIEPANSDQDYEESKQESAVLVAGPLLLLEFQLLKLPNLDLVTDRNPRTCLCTNMNALALITIDGRSAEAEGMTLYETQLFLQKIGCIDAINLDGGGSTTLWIKNKGIVNFPSDASGERPVSNVILIMRK